MKPRVLKISDLTFDWEIYPRLKVGWKTAYIYAQAIRAGEHFPPILVGTLPQDERMYVVDGWHRIEAHKMLREGYIEGVVKKFGSRNEMFVEAIELNSVHGRPLSVQEKVRLVHKLKEMNFELERISEIVKVPVDRIEQFSVKMVYGPDGTPIYLKSVVAKIETDEETLSKVDMSSFNVSSIKHLLTQLIELLKSGIYPFEDEGVKELTIQLYSLLGEGLKLTPVEAS